LWEDTYRGNPTCSEKIVTIEMLTALKRAKPNTKLYEALNLAVATLKVWLKL